MDFEDWAEDTANKLRTIGIYLLATGLMLSGAIIGIKSLINNEPISSSVLQLFFGN